MNLPALIYLSAAFLVASVFLPGGMSIANRLRVFAMYALCAYLVVLVDDYFLILFIGGTVIALVSPAERTQRTAFFLAAVPALPVYIHYNVPFPALQYLITLTPLLVAVLVVLVPTAFSARPPDAVAGSAGAGALLTLLLLSIYWGTLYGDATTASSGLRKAILVVLSTAVVLFLIEQNIRSKAAFDTAIRGYVGAAAMLAFYAMLATALQWDIYRFREIFLIANFPDFRSGFLRIQATANTHSFGYFAACAIFFVGWLRHRGDYSREAALTLQGVLLVAMLVTDSRGALLSFLIAMTLFLGLTTERRWLRTAIMTVAALSPAALLAPMLLSSNETLDAHGTFDYRRMLVVTSVDYILQYPIFGHLNFLDSGKFEHLRVGAAPGHIDITNLFLLRTLELGLIGLVLYFYVFIRPLFYSVRGEDGQVSIEGAMLKSLLIGWLVLVTTTSDVGITEHLGIVLAGLAFANRNIEQAAAEKRAAMSARRADGHAVAAVHARGGAFSH